MSRNVVYGNSAVYPIPFNPDAMYTEEMGMDLRTYIATQCLVGMGVWSPVSNVSTPGLVHRARAEYAVAQADALIAELNK